jgi:hypothetical protein
VRAIAALRAPSAGRVTNRTVRRGQGGPVRSGSARNGVLMVIKGKAQKTRRDRTCDTAGIMPSSTSRRHRDAAEPPVNRAVVSPGSLGFRGFHLHIKRHRGRFAATPMPSYARPIDALSSDCGQSAGH